MDVSSESNDVDNGAAAGGEGIPDNLAALGIGALEEAVYRWLLRQPGSTAVAVAAALDCPPPQVAAALAALQRLKFVNRETAEPNAAAESWMPELPSVAVESLLLQRQAALLSTRLVIHSLERESRRPDAADRSGVVRLHGADPAAQVHTYLQLQQQARQMLRIILRPPYLVAAPEHTLAARRQTLARGVQVRSILDADSIKLPGWRENMQAALLAGQEMRVLGALPFKLLLADDDCALLPADLQDQGGEALVVRSTSLLRALRGHFDSLWALAVPLVLDAAGEPVLLSQSGMPDPTLVTLLAAGLNDKSVAAQMGMSHRTLMRRIARLYTALDAQSRFQAGWLAARQAGPVPRAEHSGMPACRQGGAGQP